MSTTYQWGILVGILVGIVIVAAIFWFNKKTTGTINGGDFDERQQLLRGKAFQKGFLMMLILSGVYWVVVELILQRPLMKQHRETVRKRKPSLPKRMIQPVRKVVC